MCNEDDRELGADSFDKIAITPITPITPPTPATSDSSCGNSTVTQEERQ